MVVLIRQDLAQNQRNFANRFNYSSLVPLKDFSSEVWISRFVQVVAVYTLRLGSNFNVYIQWIRRMRNISTFIHEFGMARFVNTQ